MEFFSLEQLKELASIYGYWAVFAGIAIENTGIPIPGETITIIGGFLAGSGELNYWFVLLTAITGAITGDNFGYWLGRIGGWKFLLKLSRFFRLPDDEVEKAKIKFIENAAKAVFFGRFITLLRIFAGPIAGIVEMPYPKFLFYNFMGATIWGVIVVTIAYFVGKVVSLEQLLSLISQFGLVVLLLLLGWIFIPILLKSSQKKPS
ncbi:MAG: DedA family protein [Cyanobacteria bacterium]|nr:DedA family protein [Cyanobacteria bacterium CG_2015-16_32_12]NCO76764.1 DedA family protein [Cyanobacteria bacterium CG_2015-22_32_23]NCQ03898.1 DedA family protein [Cyanobacteria bacterium CG_2015-09_32_10]NCQ40808.1 DedA family protein [Cyanobacteria bacterium CG_2015-04_32_10]NCS85278.1 DedA family protein [Cyanobacteria bacterium CG_2015-02_32_10]